MRGREWMMGVEKQEIPTSSRKATAFELGTEILMAFHQVRLMAYQGDEMQEQGSSEEKAWVMFGRKQTAQFPRVLGCKQG